MYSKTLCCSLNVKYFIYDDKLNSAPNETKTKVDSEVTKNPTTKKNARWSKNYILPPFPLSHITSIFFLSPIAIYGETQEAVKVLRLSVY